MHVMSAVRYFHRRDHYMDTVVSLAFIQLWTENKAEGDTEM